MRSVSRRLGRQLERGASTRATIRARRSAAVVGRRRTRRTSTRVPQCFGDRDEHVGVAVRHALAGQHLGAEVAHRARARARSRAGSCRRPRRPRATRGARAAVRAAIATTCSSVATSASRPRSGACSRRAAPAGRRGRFDRAERLDRFLAAAQSLRAERVVADRRRGWRRRWPGRRSPRPVPRASRGAARC